MSVIFLGFASSLGAESVDTARKPLPRITPGTVVQRPSPEGWSHLILLAKPRLGAGDIEAAPTSSRKYVSMFSTVIVANVAKNDEGRFRLDEVAVGHSMQIEEKQVIVSSETAQALGAKLGLLGSRILKAAEEALAGVEQVARYDSMLLFDAKALVHHDDRHVEMSVRHMVWVSAATGRLGTAMWMMKRTPDGHQLADEHFIVLPPQLVEDRILHVDKSRFTLGVPGKDAFALEGLPPGAKYEFTPELRKFASLSSYDKQQVKLLAVAFAAALANGPE